MKKAFTAKDVVFANFFKISKVSVEGVKKWQLSKPFLDQNTFS